MVQVVTLRTGRRHDGRIGDRGAVVAADSAGHACGHGDDHQLIVCCLEAGNDDRDQDTEGSPAGTGREGEAYRDQEDDERQESCKTGRFVLDDVCDEFLGAQTVSHGLQGPCEGQDQDRGNHLLEAFRDAFHDRAKIQRLAEHVEEHSEDHRTEGAEHQTYGCVGIREGLDKACSLEETAGVDHADDAADDQRDDREEHIDNFPFSGDLGIINIRVGTVFSGIEIAFLKGVVLVLVHRAVLYFHHDHQDHHGDRKEGIIVVRNGLDEEADSVLSLDETGDGCRPGGDRSDDADRRCGRIDQVSELGAGDLVLVRDGTHNASDGQAVKIVIDEDQASEADGGELRAFSGSDLLGSPVAECGTAAGAVHELDHDAQNDQEHQNTHVVGIREHSDDTVVKDMGQGPLKAVA